jgi:LPXTG-site transpeptidase (sortase) family protein
MKKNNQPQIDKKKLLKVYREAVAKDLPLEKIDKKVLDSLQRKEVNSKFEEKADQQQEEKLWQKIPKFVRVGAAFVPLILIVVGVFLAGSAIWPIVSHYLPMKQNKTESGKLLSPVASSQISDSRDVVFASETDEEFGQEVLDEPIMIDEELDYTDLSNWFDEKHDLTALIENQFDEYILDIPELDLENATVRVGGTDLNKSLIQYPGTSLPGQSGAPVIFGHSVLRQFYNPSQENNRRYMSIFSMIMTLDEGDEIYVTYNNVKYKYLVEGHTEVHPDDTFILAQRQDSRQLKLVTCVPEGTTLRRGVVTAKLVKE